MFNKLKEKIKKIPYFKKRVVFFMYLSRVGSLKNFLLFLLLDLISRFFSNREDYFDVNFLLHSIYIQFQEKDKNLELDLRSLENGEISSLRNKKDLLNQLKKIKISKRRYLTQNKISLLEYIINGQGSCWYKAKEKELKILYENYPNFNKDDLLFGSDWYSAIGHISLMGFIGVTYPKKFTILLVNGSRIANKQLFDIVSKNFNVIRCDSIFYHCLLISQPNKFYTVDSIRFSGKKDPIKHLIHSSFTNLQVNKYRYNPRVSFKDTEFKSKLRSWYVTLHVRGRSLVKKNDPNSPARDCNINSYIKAIKFITSLGGNVIRIGDQGSAAIQKIDGFIDLTQKNRNLNNDIELLSNCLFHIGTPSGPINVPPLFGKPVLLTNAVCPIIQCTYPNSLAISKQWFNKSKNITIPYEEFIKSKLVNIESRKFGENLLLKDNSSDEILMAVKDMLALIDYPSGDSFNYELYLDFQKSYMKYLNSIGMEEIENHMPLAPSFLDNIRQ